MKTLDLNQMENLNAGGCFEGAAGGLGVSISSGLAMFGPWALVGAMVVGCIASEIADN